MITKAHFTYLQLENRLTCEVLKGAITQREAEDKLRGARQVLEALSEIPEKRLEFFLKLAALCKELGIDPAHGGDEVNQRQRF